MRDAIGELNAEVVECRRCPRLVAHREEVARTKRRMYLDWTYWGRPVPSFGDSGARALMLGLAPAAHGANRTGRMFTGDKSGEWVYSALHRHGFADKPYSGHRDDGQRLRDFYISAAVRCAPPGNKPTRQELDSCSDYLRRELLALTELRVALALGGVAHDALLRAYVANGGAMPKPRPKFGHCATYRLDGGLRVVCSYHPSRLNTQTGRLTTEMFDAALRQVAEALAAD